MIVEWNGVRPQIGKNVFIAPNAYVIGDVVLGEGCSVWFGAVIRGDSGKIRLGSGVNVQDNAVIHVNYRNNTIIDDDVTIGHAAVLEGCQIGQGTLIGMNATVLSGSIIGRSAIIAAGSVVREGFKVPNRTLAAGVPAKLKGELTEAFLKRIQSAPDHYRKYAELYQETAKYIDYGEE